MTQSWPWDSHLAVKKDHKNVYLLRNDSNNKEKQIMYGGHILATYYLLTVNLSIPGPEKLGVRSCYAPIVHLK